MGNPLRKREQSGQLENSQQLEIESESSRIIPYGVQRGKRKMADNKEDIERKCGVPVKQLIDE